MKPSNDSVHSGLDTKTAMQKIEDNTKLAAEAFSQYIRSASLDQYKHFLDTMYHYTKNTGHKAKEASENVGPKELQDFFAAFVAEEDWHYKLARDDLRAMGLQVSDTSPKEVVAFDEFWASLKDKDDNWYLGSLYVFENIVKHVAQDIREFIERHDLSKAQSRWLAEHAEADIEHGSQVAQLVEKYVVNNPGATIESSKQASLLWVDIMQEAFVCKKKAA